MKKTNNKGFSLVELIIVIAIMAILAGAIAPALIKYIDKSRKSNDISTAKTIKTAVETALGNESVYEYLTHLDDEGTASSILIKKASASSDAQTIGDFSVTIAGCSKPDDSSLSDGETEKIIVDNIGDKAPKTKYKKTINEDGEKTDSDGFTPASFTAFITKGGTVYVAVSGDSAGTCKVAENSTELTFEDCAPLAPEVCKGYQ